MTLTPEDRARIYEEEKVRREAQAQLAMEEEMFKPRFGTGKKVLLGIGVLFAIFVVGGFFLKSPAPLPEAAPEPQAAATEVPLELLSGKWGASDGGGYIMLNGEVRNDTSTPLSHVIAIATMYGKDGDLIKSDEALISYDPLMPGQRSPYQVMVSVNPAISSGTIGFKDASGKQLLYADHRKGR